MAVAYFGPFPAPLFGVRDKRRDWGAMELGERHGERLMPSSEYEEKGPK